MVPAHFEFVAELPRLTSGKVNRKALGDLPLSIAVAGRSRATTPGLAARRKRPCTRRCGRFFPARRLRGELDFFDDLGGHSLLVARLVSALRADRRYATLSIQDVYRERKLAPIAARMRQLRQKREASAAASAEPRAMDAALAVRRGAGGRDPLADAAAHFLVAVPVLRLSLFHRRPGRQHSPGGSLFRAGLPAGRVGLVPRGHRRQVAGGGAAEARPLSALGRDLFSLVAGRPPLRVAAGRSAQRHAASVLVSAGLGGEDRQGRDHRFGLRASARPAAIESGASVGTAVHIGNAGVEQGMLVLGPVHLGREAVVDSYAVLQNDTSVGNNARLGGLSALPARQSVPDGENWEGSPARRVDRPIEPLPPRPRVGLLARLAQSSVLHRRRAWRWRPCSS